MTYQVRENPDFSWSYSRAKLFDRCKKKYYFQYYGSHNGWLEDAGERARKLYRLKKMESSLAFVGKEVHQLANDLLKNGIEKDRDSYVKMIRQKLIELYKNSKDEGYREAWKYNPKQNPILKEIYLKGEIDKNLGDLIKARLKKCIDNLISSKSLEEAMATSDCITYDPLEVFNDTFEFQGTTIFAQPDLVYKDDCGRYVIVDWKTGKRHVQRDKKQLDLYYYYFYRKYNYDGKALLRLEYLVSDSREEFSIDGSNLKDIEEMIYDSIQKMSVFVKGGDLEQNQALPEEKFSINKQPDCRYCRFVEVCPVQL